MNNNLKPVGELTATGMTFRSRILYEQNYSNNFIHGDLMMHSSYWRKCLYYFTNKVLCLNLCINQSQFTVYYLDELVPPQNLKIHFPPPAVFYVQSQHFYRSE